MCICFYIYTYVCVHVCIYLYLCIDTHIYEREHVKTCEGKGGEIVCLWKGTQENDNSGCSWRELGSRKLFTILLFL